MIRAIGPAAGAALCLLLAACGTQANESSASTEAGAGPAAAPDSVVTAALQPTAPATPTRSFPNHLNAPSDLDVVLVYYDHVGLTPPIERWVDGDYEVTSADEFKRAGIRAEKLAALNSQAAQAKGVGSLTLTSSSSLGEYSTDFGEFHIATLAPGQAFVFRQNGVGVSLLLTNAADHYRLPMDRVRAEELTRKYGGRSVRLELEVAIDKARPAGDGGTLEGRITKLRVLSTDGVALT